MDLKSEEDRKLAQALCRRSDVVVENNRPGVMDRLGLGYDTLSALNPALIYCSINAFGSDGPYAHRGGFDLVIQAASGIMSVTGDKDPVKCGVPISDFATGLYGAFAIASALRETARTGIGAHIDASMLGSSIGIAALQTSEFFGTGENSPRMGSRHPRNAPYQAFKASDDYVALAAGNDKLFRDVCELVDRQDLLDREEFKTTVLRAQNQTMLADILAPIFADKTAMDWIKVFGDAGVPCGLINSYARTLSHPQVAHSGWVQPMTLPNGVETKTFGSPLRFNLQPTKIRTMPPALNEHGDEIRAELAEEQILSE